MWSNGDRLVPICVVTFYSFAHYAMVRGGAPVATLTETLHKSRTEADQQPRSTSRTEYDCPMGSAAPPSAPPKRPPRPSRLVSSDSHYVYMVTHLW
jgi:hypothetical protein